MNIMISFHLQVMKRSNLKTIPFDMIKCNVPLQIHQPTSVLKTKWGFSRLGLKTGIKKEVFWFVNGSCVGELSNKYQPKFGRVPPPPLSIRCTCKYTCNTKQIDGITFLRTVNPDCYYQNVIRLNFCIKTDNRKR